MIKINLLGEVEAGPEGAVYQIAVFSVSVLLLLLVCFFLNSSIGDQIQSVSQENDELQLQLTNLEKTTIEVKQLEAKRAGLRKKLVVIARLKRGKAGPVRVMDDLNSAVPDKAWLLNVVERSDEFQITGLALDNQTIAIFMKELEDSDYFEDVDLVEARQDRWKDVEMKKFILSVKVDYTGKIVAPKEEEGEPEVKSKDQSAAEIGDGKV